MPAGREARAFRMVRGIDTDDDARVRELHERVELTLRQARGDRLRRGPELPARDDRRDELDAVRQCDRDEVTLPYVAIRQFPRELVQRSQLAT
jgi:hypothetical protein